MQERTVSASPRLQWFAVLAPPLAWAVQLLLVFGLTEAVVCTPGSRTPGRFAGLDMSTVIQIVNAVAAAIIASALVVSWRRMRRLRSDDTSPAQRARWMALAGLFNGALFMTLTLVSFASPAFLPVCAHTL